jgi:hypothetical protein
MCYTGLQHNVLITTTRDYLGRSANNMQPVLLLCGASPAYLHKL